MPYDPYQSDVTLRLVKEGKQKVNLRPDEYQRRWLDLGFGIMVHFGINTYYDAEWSDGTLDAGVFNPREYNPRQWATAARDGGARYLLIVSKHHDGFCNWATDCTAYNSRNTPFGRDLLGELAEACRDVGIRMGLYYSLWDRHEPSFEHDRGYAFFMKRQLTELLTRYGEIAEIWFDGGWQKGGVDWQDPDRWHWLEIYEHIKSIQPGCMVGNNGTSGRSGHIVLWPCDFRIGEKKLPPEDDKKIYYCGGIGDWLPFEAVYTLSEGGDKKGPFPSGKWFWHETDLTAHSADWVLERLVACRERGANLLLNAGPTSAGLLRDVDVAALRDVGRKLASQGGLPPLKSVPAAADGANPDAAITA